MDMNEFKAKRLRTDDEANTYLDLRPFGPKESEALQFYLDEAVFAVGNRKIATTTKKIILICEPMTEIPASAETQIRQLKEMGQAVEIRPEHRETSE